MSDSVWPHRWQPTRIPLPGILQARTPEWVAISFSNAWKWKWSHSVVSDTLQPHGLQPTRLLCPWDFPDKSTGVGCHCLLRINITDAPKWVGTTVSLNQQGYLGYPGEIWEEPYSQELDEKSTRIKVLIPTPVPKLSQQVLQPQLTSQGIFPLLSQALV